MTKYILTSFAAAQKRFLQDDLELVEAVKSFYLTPPSAARYKYAIPREQCILNHADPALQSFLHLQLARWLVGRRASANLGPNILPRTKERRCWPRAFHNFLELLNL